MKSADIREKFLGFFESRGHKRVKSSSVIPAADPTLLFTNAGMVQFKDCFLGLSDLGFRRATTSQKCVRAGGKHNDLENVGFTARHHTFFEMLGNFSFGDYFKKEAISFAWEFLTKDLALPKEKLRITVFEKDDEAFELWKGQGIRPDWIERLGEKDNFWAMGETGPCGPCTEIYYDWGNTYGCGKPTCSPGCPCSERFLEIWNLVFMQFNRDASGTLTPLPKPSVDTGSGLERVTCVMQGVYSNYDTDLFQPILAAIGNRVGTSYGKDKEASLAMRVIADHVRSGTFLIADGVIPSNEGRGYVLRRILRRAIRYGKKLGQEKPFIFEIVSAVVATLGSFYPEIKSQQKLVETMIREEEERFHETLHRGTGILDEAIQKAKKEKRLGIPGDVAFKLYDTFGFPYDLVEVICREHGLQVEEKVFQELMEKQRSLSSGPMGSVTGYLATLTKYLTEKRLETQFKGYDSLREIAKLVALFDSNGNEASLLKAGVNGFAIFDLTPFYAESGGQVGDSGTITHNETSAQVRDTVKVAKAFVHKVHVQTGEIKVGQSYTLEVDARSRKLAAINHTATHLLHAALRKVLGDRVKQAGSLVSPERLRFDFTFPRAATAEELAQIEGMVNAEIRLDLKVDVKEMPFDEAIKSGALAFFDEKYGDRVRVVKVGPKEAPFSVELCGGTHLSQISDIVFVKILGESSVASGTRRLEAITADAAIQYLLGKASVVREIEGKLATTEVVKRIDQMASQIKTLSKENEDLKLKVARAGQGGGGGELYEKASRIGQYQLVAETIPSGSAKILRTLVDQVRDKLKEKTVVMLATTEDGKVSLCIGLTKDIAVQLDAGKLIRPLAEEVSGTGGGRPDFAQAGGSRPEGIPKAIEKLRSLLKDACQEES